MLDLSVEVDQIFFLNCIHFYSFPPKFMLLGVGIMNFAIYVPLYRFKCTPDDAWQKQLALGHLGDLKHSFKSSNKSRYQFLLLWQFRWWLAQVNEFSNLESFSSCIRFQNMYVYFCIFIFSDVWTSDSNNFKLRQYKMHSSND